MTIDLEDWYDLHYLEKYSLSKELFFLKRLYPFLSFLDDFNIKAIFCGSRNSFVSRSLIEDIASRGHEIACHGLDHRRLDTKSLELIKIELQEARNLLGPIANEEVIGYRAPAFSISDEVFPLLRNLGFTYDSSLSYSRASNKIDLGQMNCQSIYQILERYFLEWRCIFKSASISLDKGSSPSYQQTLSSMVTPIRT